MKRLTIAFSEDRYRASKEAAAQRNKTIGNLIDESLAFDGIKSRLGAPEPMRRAWEHCNLSEQYALAVAQEPVKAVRRKHRAICVARVLNGMLSASFAFVVSEALLAECRVLLRPKPMKPHLQSVRAIGF